MNESEEKFDANEAIRLIVEQARANVNDCRMHYMEIQLDKSELDQMASHVGVPPIDWHPDPCRHPGTKWTNQ